jgi:hypothetical protein
MVAEWTVIQGAKVGSNSADQPSSIICFSFHAVIYAAVELEETVPASGV